LSRRLLALILAASLVSAPLQAEVQLPNLGESSQEGLSPLQERQIGESAMRELRRSGAMSEDPELVAYLRQLGGRLLDASGETETNFVFFPMLDRSINAFAIPGGLVGVHTGLIVLAQHESELASVLSHEIAHVTQHHFARLLEGQKMAPWVTLAALGLAIVAASAGKGDVAMASLMGSQAYMIQRQLDYTYMFEQEADRIGMQTLQKAGLDQAAMPIFFDRMQKSSRLGEGNAPEFLRTHPVTYKRISDAQARLKDKPYQQFKDSLDFLFVREKARFLQMDEQDALEYYRKTLSQKKYGHLPSHLYGLALAQLRAFDADAAWATLQQSKQALGKTHSSLEYLAGSIRLAQKRPSDALQIFKEASKRFPASRALVYGEIDALIANQQLSEALASAQYAIELYPSDAYLWQRISKIQNARGDAIRQHQAQAEYYSRLGEHTAAIEQLQQAQNAGSNDFYLLSAIEARLKELKQLQVPIK
jgi:predicted Zn-dependent protease